MFGLDGNAFDDHSDFLQHSLQMFHHVSVFRSIVWKVFPILNKILPIQFVTRNFNNWFVRLYRAAVDLRKKNNVERDDFLNFLMELQKKKNSQTISSASNAFTFFLNGFETTSYILGSAINELAKNKLCQEKLRTEVRSVRCRGLDDFTHMPYLDAVVNGKW